MYKYIYLLLVEVATRALALSRLEEMEKGYMEEMLGNAVEKAKRYQKSRGSRQFRSDGSITTGDRALANLEVKKFILFFVSACSKMI